MSFPRYPTYKDSGVEWLGEVPEHFEVRRVRRIFDIKKRIAGELGFDILSITQQGIKVRDSESNDGQVSMDYSKYQIVEPGDFAMNHMDLLTGYVDISRSLGVTSPDYRVFSIAEHCPSDPGYLLYVFQMGYKRKILYAYGQGSSQLGRWRLPTEGFQEWSIPFPSREEQVTISTFLDNETAKIDALIAKQQRLIELLQEKRQAVISHAVTKGLNPDAPMKDSGVEWLGEVPKHWQVTTIKRIVATPVTDGPHETPAFLDEGIPFVSAEAVSSGHIDFERIRGFISKEDHRRYSQKYIPKRDDIFMIKSGATTGVSAIVDTDAEFNIWSPLAVIRCGPEVLPRFCLHFIRSGNFLEGVTLGWTFGTQQNIGMGVIENLAIVVPPLAVQHQIVELLDSMTHQSDALMGEVERAIYHLKERRSALISAAVTGQIDVRGLVPEVAVA